MRTLIFLDLDDTIFQTQRKLRGEPAEPVAYRKGGEALSFMTARQRAFLDGISRMGEVVPTTGRNVSAFRRVNLPFRGHAICSFGGVILAPDGSPDPRWRQQIEDAVAGARGALTSLEADLVETARKEGLNVRASLVHDLDLPLYLSVKHNAEDEAELARMASLMVPTLPAGFRLHRNGNNLAVLPGFLDKSAAVRYFLDEIVRADVLTLGVGDSDSDRPFLSLCDFAVLPVRSQLFGGRP